MKCSGSLAAFSTRNIARRTLAGSSEVRAFVNKQPLRDVTSSVPEFLSFERQYMTLQGIAECLR